MKLVTRSHYKIAINKIFADKHLPVQTQRNVNVRERYSICSNLLIKLLQQCH